MELRYCEKCGDIIPYSGGAAAEGSPGQFVCSRCGGTPVERNLEAGVSLENILEQTQMNFFSPGTVAIRRKEQMDKEAQLEGLEGPPDERPGSATPARSARKLQFHCLHCRSVLMVRPVQK